MKSTLLALTFVIVQCMPWFGTNGLWGLIRLNHRIQLQQRENIERLDATKRLESKVNQLKKETDTSCHLIEDHMRWKLELVKPGEWFCHW